MSAGPLDPFTRVDRIRPDRTVPEDEAEVFSDVQSCTHCDRVRGVK